MSQEPKTSMTTTQRLRATCSRVAKQINEFGRVVDGEAIDDLDAALCAAYREGAVGDVHPFMVTMLRQIAQQRARASQMMAESKTARNRAAGEPNALYLGGAAEDMLEWKAADEIRRLRDRVSELEEAREGRMVGDGR